MWTNTQVYFRGSFQHRWTDTLRFSIGGLAPGTIWMDSALFWRLLVFTLERGGGTFYMSKSSRKSGCTRAGGAQLETPNAFFALQFQSYVAVVSGLTDCEALRCCCLVKLPTVGAEAEQCKNPCRTSLWSVPMARDLRVALQFTLRRCMYCCWCFRRKRPGVF